jgi:hypothetical protein
MCYDSQLSPYHRWLGARSGLHIYRMVEPKEEIQRTQQSETRPLNIHDLLYTYWLLLARMRSLPSSCDSWLSFHLGFLFKMRQFECQSITTYKISGIWSWRNYLWTVEINGCLCSCRIMVFSATAPVITDLLSSNDNYYGYSELGIQI